MLAAGSLAISSVEATTYPDVAEGDGLLDDLEVVGKHAAVRHALEGRADILATTFLRVSNPVCALKYGLDATHSSTKLRRKDSILLMVLSMSV